MAQKFKRKNLFQITFPLFFYGAMTIGVSFADTMLLSNYQENLAASVSMANQILGVAYDLSGLISIGALVLISQYLGRDEVAKARGVAVTGIIASFGLGALIASVLVIGARFFAEWVNTPAEIYEDVVIYVYIIAAAMMFNGFIMAAKAVLTGFGHTLEILVLGLIGNVTYIGIEYMMVYGVWIFPEMGIYGAGLSTVVVRLSSIALLLFILYWRLGITLADLEAGFWQTVRKILKISTPSVGENLSYNLYQLAIVSMVAALGVSGVLTRSYSLTVASLLLIITMVISHGNQVLVGYDKGGDDDETAFRRARKTALATAGVGMIASLLLYIFSDFFAGLLTSDPEILASVKQILLVQIFVTPCSAVNLILFNSLKACGYVNRPVLTNLTITFALALPLAYLAMEVLDVGVEGLWYAYLTEEALKGTAMYLLWRRRTWQSVRLIPDAAAG
ncbi:MATE family efflux transporter [Nisaea acidiphila]|uniref:MATE family efflux transporter n=1 Tax=Nisaea acidiphila TaxID=1862145 RepID=A0A9J7ATN0_9PROT|nr:MATE family efflux transporter [Nisaea acidiphila]UUX51051.1 MATE family efflux transporter [Nisaea acidiphila]